MLSGHPRARHTVGGQCSSGRILNAGISGAPAPCQALLPSVRHSLWGGSCPLYGLTRGGRDPLNDMVGLWGRGGVGIRIQATRASKRPPVLVLGGEIVKWGPKERRSRLLGGCFAPVAAKGGVPAARPTRRPIARGRRSVGFVCTEKGDSFLRLSRGYF